MILGIFIFIYKHIGVFCRAALLTAVEQKVGEWVRSRVVFNPPSKHSELPLKSYYRYVAGLTPDETVTFEDIPREPLFTQNIAVSTLPSFNNLSDYLCCSL